MNDFLDGVPKPSIIQFNDLVTYEESYEYFTEVYNFSDCFEKFPLLVEYYKFHNEIPRIFMKPVCNVVNKYHDKKRRMEYYRVKKML